MELFPFKGSSDVQRARRLVGEFGADGVGHVRAKAELLAGELVRNALQYGRGAVQMCLSRTDDGVLLVEVSDEGPAGFVRPAPAVGNSPSPGLRIVECFALQWGVAPLDNGRGKTIWFTV